MTSHENKELRRKWIRALSLRRKNYKWKSSDRVCSAHFPGGHKHGTNNIPSIFPRRDLKSGNIVWPVDISSLLRDKQCPTGEDKNKSTSTASANTTKAVSVNGKNVPPRGKPNNDNVAMQQGLNVKEFGVNRFMFSDSDIRFYNGLPDYKTFVALYNFLKPWSGFQLNYYNGYINVTKHRSYVVSR